MTFEEDLTKRRIDVAAFAAGDPERFADWRQMYAQMHPNSFYVSVKMVINDVRRRFWLAEAVKPVAPTATTEAPARPAGRRAAIPGAPKPVSSEITTESETSTPTENVLTPGKAARPVFRKPMPANPEERTEQKTEVPKIIPTDNTGETPKPAARPRPVFKKPIPAAEILQSADQVAETGTNSELPVHTNPVPVQGEDPALLNPIISSPNPLVDESVAPSSASAIPDEPSLNEKVEEPKATPRPRPVFKRPAATNPEVIPETNTSVPAEPLPVETDTKLSEPDILNPAIPEQPKPTPPRPRPVFRRPSETKEPGELNKAEPIITAPVEPKEEVKPSENSSDSVLNGETPKPPRPRPIFKRPAKPDEPEV